MRNASRFVKEIPKSVLIIFIFYFVQGIIHNLGHPVTPSLVEGMGISDYYFGIYFSAMSLGLLIGAPIWGVLGDRGNKRRYILIGLILYSIGQFMFAFVGDKNIMILFRFLSGFGVSASITLLMSHLIENSSKENRTMYLGWFQALFVLGASVGYWIAGELTEVSFFIKVLNTNDYRNIFLIQSLLNVVHASLMFLVLGKGNKVVVTTQTERVNIFKAFKDIKKLDKTLLLFLIALAFISLGAINVSKFIEVYMNDNALSPKKIGDFVGATGFVAIGTTIFLVPLIVKLKRDFTFMIIFQILSAIIIFIVFRSNEILVTLYTVFMLYMILKSAFSPLEQNYISSHAPEGQYGSMMGVRQLFLSIGLVVGPLLGGLLYEIKPLLVFDFSVLMFIIGFVLLLIVGRKIKNGNTIETE